MSASDVAETVADMRNETIAEAVAQAIPEHSLPEQWDLEGMHAEGLHLLALNLPLAEWAKEEGIDGEAVQERIAAAADRHMAEKTANYGPELMRMAEKSLLLQLLDQTWKDHLLSLDHLRQGINLRAYAQRDPLNEYKREAFDLFEEMLVNLRQQVTSVLSHVELRMEPPPPPPPGYAEMIFGEPIAAEQEMEFAEAGAPAAKAGGRPRPRGGQGHANADGGNGLPRERGGERLGAPRAPWAGTPRNAPCPCGSGKKFKHCHGRI